MSELQPVVVAAFLGAFCGLVANLIRDVLVLRADRRRQVRLVAAALIQEVKKLLDHKDICAVDDLDNNRFPTGTDRRAVIRSLLMENTPIPRETYAELRTQIEILPSFVADQIHDLQVEIGIWEMHRQQVQEWLELTPAGLYMRAGVQVDQAEIDRMVDSFGASARTFRRKCLEAIESLQSTRTSRFFPTQGLIQGVHSILCRLLEHSPHKCSPNNSRPGASRRTGTEITDIEHRDTQQPAE